MAKFKARTVTREEVTISVAAEEEHSSIRRAAKETGREEDFIIAVHENQKKSVYGWCTVRVRASYKGFQGNDYLGQCSYSSKEDFINNSGYYEQMVAQAIDDLNKNIAESFDKFKDLIQVDE